MFPSQMVRLKIVKLSICPLFCMFQSQMVCLKIVEPSSNPLFPCFPRKWYALKLSNPQVAHFFNVSLANGTPYQIVEPSSQVAHFFHVSHAHGTPWNCRNLKWPTLSMFPSQMVRLKIVEPLSGPLCPCFPLKWYALKLSKSQVAHFFHVSLTNGTP